MRISIVINNFNYRQFVGKSIESALHQTHPDVEVIVVDDGSTDGSPSEIQKFSDRVKLVEKPNGGQGSAYNLGYRHATGAVILFLDADDWLYPQAAAQVASCWHPGVSKVQFPLEMVDLEGQSLGRQVPRNLDDRDAFALLKEFGTYGSPPGSGNAFAAQFLQKVLPMDEATWRTSADSVPILLAPAYGEVISLREPLGAYRLHRRLADDSLLSNNAPNSLWHEYHRIQWSKRFVEQALSRLGKHPRVPQLMAPWEARIAALCVRFGGEPKSGLPSGAQIMGFALRSVWTWPLTGIRMKSALSIWMVGVWLLPRPWAQWLARMHKTSIGAPLAS